MAAKNYKIGDRVVMVSKWVRPMNERFNRHLGKIRTIDSICERIVGHNKRDKFYRFADAQEEGYFWDDKDIVGLAPMIPKKVFPIQENQRVVLLARDGATSPVPGTVVGIGEEFFSVRDEYSKRIILFRNDNFVCDDPDQCNRMLVFESEDAMKKDQLLFHMQKDMQCICTRYMEKVPTVEDLIGFAKLMGLWDEDRQASPSNAPNAFDWDLFYPPEKQEKTMLIKYRNRTFRFDDGYFALATSEGNPCDSGCGVALRNVSKGGKFGWSTTDVIHICCFNTTYCAEDLAKALNDAKNAGIKMFDVDEWIQEKIDNDARPENLQKREEINVKPVLCSYDN